MKNDKYIKLETGQVINYGNKPNELKEDDFNSIEKNDYLIFFAVEMVNLIKKTMTIFGT